MKRRLATLATIARLDDRRLRQAAAELAPLQARLAALATEAGELDRRRQQESAVTLVEAMPYLGRFLATLRREADRIAADRAVIERAVEAKRDEVLQAWSDLRSKEHLRDALLARARQRAMQAGQAEADERGVMAHARQTRLSQRQGPPD